MTGLNRINPQKRRIQRPSGEQDTSVGAAPSFGKRTKVVGIINCSSISSHTYIKEASEGHGFAMWRMPSRGFAIAVDKIYLRKGGNLQTIATDDIDTATNYVNITQNKVLVSRINTTGTGSAGAFFGLGSDSNGVLGESSDGAGSGYGVRGVASGSGDGVQGQSSTGRAGYFVGAVEMTGTVIMSGIPTSDPSVAGAIFRTGNDLRISTG